ncbi:MAG: endolytic transglycosylase MltG [Desulfobacula sp.]|nr:endolytic transglycosylase MltG [Desulfobacula sp.]
MKKKVKKKLILLSIIMLIYLAGMAFLYDQISSFIQSPARKGAAQILFTIHPGQSLSTIADNLENSSLITNKLYFKIFVRYKKSGTRLQAGEYLLSATQTPGQILETLLKGKVKLYKITIPEGLNINEIALLMEKKGICTANTFVTLCYDQNFIKTLNIKATSLEGYLFPDTYFFPKKTKCPDIITSMVNNFNQIYTNKWKKRTATLGFVIHEVVTLASIIEKETGDASERPLISSVFHNRLKKRMRLESDPTVIYGIKNFDGNIKRKHLKMLTPYNTYQIKGLPVGPIANPGAKSIEAALYPATSDFIFFVSKKDTTHQFSKTILEHNRAVRKYQLRKK